MLPALVVVLVVFAAVRMDGENAMWACARNGGDWTDPLDCRVWLTFPVLE